EHHRGIAGDGRLIAMAEMQDDTVARIHAESGETRGQSVCLIDELSVVDRDVAIDDGGRFGMLCGVLEQRSDERGDGGSSALNGGWRYGVHVWTFFNPDTSSDPAGTD